MELTLAAFEFLFDVLVYSLNLFDVLSGVIKVIPEAVGDLVMPLLKGFTILGMDGDQSIFHIL